VAKVMLNKAVTPGDSLCLDADYEFSIPSANGRTGYVPEEDYYCIAQWFIKPGVFKDGKWICSPFFPFTEFFSDFGNYTVTIETPKEYQISSSGANIAEEAAGNGKKTCTFTQKNVIDFAWVATRNFETETYNVPLGSGSAVTTQIVYPKTFAPYIPRYKNSLSKCFKYFREHFEGYPYKTFTLVITPPKSGMTGSMEYPALVTISQALFSPEKSLEPEQTIIHEFAHQYFYGILANNEVYEAWLDEGFAEFLTDRILESYSQRPSKYFSLFGRFPIKGIEFLALGELPLMYSLTDIKAPVYANDLKEYYDNLTAGSLADSSYLLTDETNYDAISYSKAHIFLKTIEEYVGERVMDKILKEYYQRFKYGHPTAGDFFKVCAQYSPKKIDWLINDYYSQSLICDYKVNKIYKNPGVGYWTVEIKREGEGRFPMRLDLYTDKDTLSRTIYLTNRYTSVQFKTKNEVVGAELDPKRKVLFDINFANNSYFIDNQFGSSLYLSTRWFYWIQSLLLIFGGLV
jgi:aminopeptidase N